jgi:hypothetical protein
MRTRPALQLLAAAIAALGLGALVPASAAGFGVSSRTLFAFHDPAAVTAPPVVTCDNFAKSSSRGNQLTGRPVQLPANCGPQSWETNTGTWKITGGRLDSTGTNATATLNAGVTDASVEATFSNANSAGRVGGVLVAHSGGSSPRYLAAVLAGPNGVQLRLSDGAALTTIATSTASYGSTTRLRLTYVGGTAQVAIGGVIVLIAVLTPTQQALLAGSTRAGLYDTQGSVKFDDILITQAWLL